jgi:hypothetical protein
MRTNGHSEKKASLGQQAQFADKRRGPREAQASIDTPESQEMGAQEFLVASADNANDELRPEVNGQPVDFGMNPRTDSRGWKQRQETDYDWSRDPEVGPNRRHGETLAAQEKRLGQERELEENTEMAREMEKDGYEREWSARVQNEKMADQNHVNSACVVPKEERPEEFEVDPRELLDQEKLAAVNKAARKLARKYSPELKLDEPDLAELIARRVARNEQSVLEATMRVKTQVERNWDVTQDLETIDPYEQHMTTVEGEITTLWEPKHGSQRQVGIISDGTETAKVVVWQNSGDKPTMREGDQVRLERVKVNAYKGDATLAVDGEAEIVREERGDGAAPRHGRQSDDPKVAPWETESDQHAWISEVDMERAVEVTITDEE